MTFPKWCACALVLLLPGSFEMLALRWLYRRCPLLNAWVKLLGDHMKRLICMLVVSLYLAGCTTLSTVPYSGGTFEKDRVRKGDQVVLTTIRGEYRFRDVHRFQVTSVTPEQICGKDECFRADAIETVQRQEFDALKTAALVAGIALIFALTWRAPLAGGLRLPYP